jgi:hypothetical protein
MEERKSSTKARFNLISCDFKQILRSHNDSPHNQLEFRSLEPNSLKANASVHEAIKENSYSDVIKAFMQKIHDRNKNRGETSKSFSKLASSTPFKRSENEQSFNISGIAHLDTTIRRKIDCSHNRGISLNDSDFESMDQDQYDDTKENNVHVNSVSVEIIKCMQLNSASKDKKLRGSSEKFKRHSSPYKSKKSSRSGKSIKVTRENSQAFLKSANKSLASIITTESIREIEEDYPLRSQSLVVSSGLDIINESLDFAFTHPNKTQSFEASIKNLTQLSVSTYLRFQLLLPLCIHLPLLKPFSHDE